MYSIEDEHRFNKLYVFASALALITIFYNIAEGLVSVFFGFEGRALSLTGFGIDSFVEVLSGVGIWHMLRRMAKSEGDENFDNFEVTALKITGSGFYILSTGLSVTAAINLYQGRSPDNTFWGIVISVISIITMLLLVHYKRKVGIELDSQAILSDAACTRVCVELSVVLLVASAGYELTHIGGLDAIGSFLISWISFKEGREAFEMARRKNNACSCGETCETEKK